MANLTFKRFLKNWRNILFRVICGYSFLVALVILLEIPTKVWLTGILVQLGVTIVVLVCLRFTSKSSFPVWRKKYLEVASDEDITTTLKTLLLPCLLFGLYFFARFSQADGGDGRNILYSTSPIRCEMVVHPCGASYENVDTPEERKVWDAADLITQPSASEVFVITNAVELEQTRGSCPQTGAYCSNNNINPGKQRPFWLGSNISWTFSHEFSRAQIWNPISCSNEQCELGVLYDNGIQTGDCTGSAGLCNIDGWCDPLALEDFSPEPMFETSEFSLFLDLRPDFPEFNGVSWTGGGSDGNYSANYAEIYAKHYGYGRSVENCVYDIKLDPYCPRILLKDIVAQAGADFTEAATYGGQFKVEVQWNCKFDWGFDIYDCMPKFRFLNRENNKGKPKTHSQISRLDTDYRRITYSLGLSISIEHVGKGLQITIPNFVLFAQFIYVSFAMIKGPFLWLLRCLCTAYLVTFSKTSDSNSK